MYRVSNPDLSEAVPALPSQPPPVPTRPASYTPSTHDSLNALNNLDGVRNYGSAGDELENNGGNFFFAHLFLFVWIEKQEN